MIKKHILIIVSITIFLNGCAVLHNPYTYKIVGGLVGGFIGSELGETFHKKFIGKKKENTKENSNKKPIDEKSQKEETTKETISVENPSKKESELNDDDELNMPEEF